MIPDSLKDHIVEQTGQSITSSRRVSGGSINQAALIELEDTGRCFLKWNTATEADLFAKEVRGLALLRSAETDLIVPRVIEQATYNGDKGYLLLEYIEEGSGSPASSKAFGRELAALHKTRHTRYGLDHNNYIGKLPQSNYWHDEWIDFFIQERMEPQVSMAVDAGKLSGSVHSSFQRMYQRLPGIFPDEPPSLLHGDLWGGNYFFNSDGKAAIYDPAVYYGNREMEISFTKMFGGFSPEFYRAYNDVWPLSPDFNSRKDIYNLYPLLVHANLFGGHYARQVVSVVRQF
ncbi:fructosamine kinase family protein [Halalkalibaculum sp. DA3122]|uniref:fructosamine kinase family protein n=1 Tax=unclassified Halalkalibaculum TaxID=2964617 RepID=UPI003754AA05